MKARDHQSGFALLVFVIVLLGIAGVFGSNLIQGRAKTVQFEKAQHDQEVLQKAKQALLAYAVQYKIDNDSSEMGRLPCPDYNTGASEGAQDGSCGGESKNIAGFLPWKTLGIDALKDSSGECLWYVVSGDYKDSPKADMLNEDTNGLLKVQGESGLYHGGDASDRPIALIIAPGPALDGQNRTPSSSNLKNCRGKYGDEEAYLEGGSIDYSVDHVDVADAIWTYFYGNLSNSLKNTGYNDRMVWITKSEYWNAIKAQADLDAADPAKDINLLTAALAQCLVNYANDSNNEHRWLPWPASIDMSEYRTDNLYQDLDDPSDLMGRFPADITHSNDKEDDETSTPITLFSNLADILSDPDCLPSSGPPPTPTYSEKKLWQNWKDHFFYVVSEDFKMDGSSSVLSSRCGSVGDCVTVDEMTSGHKVAGIVFYANSVVNSQIRDAEPVDSDKKNDLSNYLDSRSAGESNAHQYPNDSTYQGASGDVNKYYSDISTAGSGTADLAYCIVVDPFTPAYLMVSDCN